MRCVVCRNGETADGETTVTLLRGALVMVVRKVPAEVCASCGETYVGEDVAARLMASVDAAAREGAEVEVRTYAAA